MVLLEVVGLALNLACLCESDPVGLALNLACLCASDRVGLALNLACLCGSDRFPGTDRLRTSPFEFSRSLRQRNRPEAESGGTVELSPPGFGCVGYLPADPTSTSCPGWYTERPNR